LARGWQAGFNEARPVGGNLSAHGRYVSLVKKEPGSMAPAIAVLGLLRRGYLGTAMLIGLIYASSRPLFAAVMFAVRSAP